ncbi:MAG: Crp/Fnr family transcriptional regulator [Chloracidobacterium sp.]|nr:Crp/Fnr family transcriptional regulator [Chloracidobacterium sp.]
MKPNGLSIQEKCNECGLSRKGFFCHLPETDLHAFESIKITRSYPKRTTLFAEGQPAKGVYMLCQGKVKLSTCSPDGKMIILEVAEPGDVLGLSAALNGKDYETTAQVLELCQVNYVKTADLLRFLKTNPEACLNAAHQLSRNYQTAYRQVCSLGLSDSVADKLAKLFLGWSRGGISEGDKVRIKNFFTHEEMAEMIGASRETVTRALKYFRENGLITVRGSELIILDKKLLKAAIGTRMSKGNGLQNGHSVSANTHENNGDLFHQM